jgi:thioredoxin reductase
LGGNREAAELAIELLQWSRDVILCSNGPFVCDEKPCQQMKRGGIAIVETAIARIEGEGDALSGVRFADGSFLPRTVIFFSPGQHQRSSLAEKLGCEFCDDGCIQCAEDTTTCVPGIYAAGNASRGIQLVITAAHEGTMAAVAINNALIEADADSGALGGD